MLHNRKHLNNLLLESLPHSAMLISKDRIILAANSIARKTGIKIGDFCWKKSKPCTSISEKDKKNNSRKNHSPSLDTKCHFCLADKALVEQIPIKKSSIKILDKIWKIYWIPLNKEAYLHYALDITKRKQREKELKSAREEYYTITNLTGDIIVKVDSNGKWTFLNEGASKFLGKPIDKLLGEKFADYIHPDDVEKTNAAIKKLIKTKKIVKGIINRQKTPNGWRTIEWNGAPIFNGNGNIIGFQATGRDITEQTYTKQIIKEMTYQIEKFSAIAADLMSIEDESELFKRISEAIVDNSDYNRVLVSYFKDETPYREIIGHRGIKKEDLERVKKVEMPREKYLSYFNKGIKIGSQSCYIPYELKHILDQQAVIMGEKKYPEKKGYWHKEDNLLVFLKDSKGQVIGIISVDDSKSGLAPTKESVRPLEVFANLISSHIQRRILARKIIESEEKYRELVSNIKVGIIRATPAGDLLEVNPAVVEMFGYNDSLIFLTLKGADLFLNPDNRAKYVAEMEEKGMVKNKEFIFKRKTGKPFWVSMTSNAIRDISGKIKYYDSVIEDITERKKLEEEVKRLSITDELTGLYNRRYFNQNLPKEIKRAERWKSYLSLIMIDIDDFKKYNDHYHHLKGDKILKEISNVIFSNIRKDIDWATRFGGEEFAIVLPGTDLSEAYQIAERIRSVFNTVGFKPLEEIVYKTISLGIAQCHFPEFDENESRTNTLNETNHEKNATELTSLADQALFRAKNLGKNRVVVSQSSLILTSPS